MTMKSARAAVASRRFRSKLWLLILTLLFILPCTRTGHAQGLMIYPAKGQTQAQQNKDRYECHTWAVQQSGFDPTNPQAAAPAPAAGTESSQAPRSGVVKGAGRGAALGAVGGAITGNAGKGAAAGAAMGGLAGGMRRRDERRQQASQQAATTQSAQQNQQMAYNRAVAACLEGRGYTVK